MSELDDLQRRVSDLEASHEETHGEARRAAELFAMVDRDVADLSAKFRAQTGILNALRETQREQSVVLAEHSAVLAEQGAVLAEQGAVLAEHSAVLAEHGAVLAGHSVVLAEHGAALEHIKVNHGAMLEQIVTMVGTLMPGEDA